CSAEKCAEPLTFTPPGVPCGCVWPIQIGLRLNISLYRFFPLVSDLTQEIAANIPLHQSQVRITGANAADLQLEKTTVNINLVPLDAMFSSSAALSVYNRFWNRGIPINSSTFGAYEVLYVWYPGLPSAPSRPSAVIPGSRPNDGGSDKPLAVNIPRERKSDSSRNMIIIIVISFVMAFVACTGFLLLCMSKLGYFSALYKQSEQQQQQQQPSLEPSETKAVSGGHDKLFTALRSPLPYSSTSMSISSSLLACTGTAKVLSIEDIERATVNFSESRILGEGGFGKVYGGILDDGRSVAVKILKRDNIHQGSREFLAEVEILGRLHHRNLVKLIGICAEDHCRCLVYELVPNGSLLSHLHGCDKDVDPLDWSARMKIALGAARGLAYLHEDSNPPVIHRDFKSSNILLEYDYTPKVSDFGLARAAATEDEGAKRISTHVMGTFGYLAPEYAMTGHLLVKSDVYSYGVVLLELLTGREPIDFSQPAGEENLVSWARPLLATKEGIESIIDPYLKPNVAFGKFAKVAAIASMCVQPEVSHRPFMGEVVQALKLVCNEFEEPKIPVSRSCSQEEFLVDIESRENWDSGLDSRLSLSALDLKSSSASLWRQEYAPSSSIGRDREFNSEPVRWGRKRKLLQHLRSRGSLSD
ncbi:hypothetical protein M569_00433, partial [Genlisea aurea]